MNITLLPGPLAGTVEAPPSKACAHRLLILCALSGGGNVQCPPGGEDLAATVRCLRALGCEILEDAAGWRVKSGPIPEGPPARLVCGESGSTLRFLLPLCACMARKIAITGRAGLARRPLLPLLSALAENGAAAEGAALPLTLEGGLRPGTFALPGNVSSQFFTGLLLALPLLPEDSRLLWTTPLESRPYVDWTRALQKQFGVESVETPEGFFIPGGQRYRAPERVIVEGDWSAAACWLTANRMGGRVRVTGLRRDSPQGDRAIERLLDCLSGTIDLKNTPDLGPVLAIAAAAAPGVTRLTGAGRLRLKESDRLAAMARLIRALGGRAEETPDGLTIFGGPLRGGAAPGAGDHRVVMSAALAATVCREPVTILGAEAVEKSYPHFFRDYQRLGGRILP